MPRPNTTTPPARLRLRALHTLLTAPERYNIASLADELGETWGRTRDAVADIESEFGLQRSGQSQLITVILPGQAVLL